MNTVHKTLCAAVVFAFCAVEVRSRYQGVADGWDFVGDELADRRQNLVAPFIPHWRQASKTGACSEHRIIRSSHLCRTPKYARYRAFTSKDFEWKSSVEWLLAASVKFKFKFTRYERQFQSYFKNSSWTVKCGAGVRWRNGVLWHKPLPHQWPECSPEVITEYCCATSLLDKPTWPITLVSACESNWSSSRGLFPQNLLHFSFKTKSDSQLFT